MKFLAYCFIVAALVLSSVGIIRLVIGSIINKWFVNLVLVKPIRDDTSLPAWALVRSSLYVPEPALKAPSKIGQSVDVLNAKALKLARPEYPVEARYGGLGGVVAIDVEIDELGNVTLACVRSGHPLLREASLDAARKSKFSPTKPGEKPIRTGVLQFNFVPQKDSRDD
jgi:TonB family protein